MNQTIQLHSPLAQRIQGILSQLNDPYHTEAAGMQVELRYRENTPSLQQKIIQLCNQSLEM